MAISSRCMAGSTAATTTTQLGPSIWRAEVVTTHAGREARIGSSASVAMAGIEVNGPAKREA